jgi:hypothetical protein
LSENHSRFAHHPTCQCYNHHLIRCGRWNFCLGCTCLIFGIVMASFLILVGYIIEIDFVDFRPIWLFVGTLLLLIPTFIQIRYQRKLFKLVSRLLLGIGIVMSFYTGVFMLPPAGYHTMYGICFAVSFVVLAKLTLWIRNRYSQPIIGFCSNLDCPNRPNEVLDAVLKEMSLGGDAIYTVDYVDDASKTFTTDTNRTFS